MAQKDSMATMISVVSASMATKTFLEYVKKLGIVLHQFSTAMPPQKFKELSSGLVLLAATAKRDPNSIIIEADGMIKEMDLVAPSMVIKIKEAAEALRVAAVGTAGFIELATFLLNLLARGTWLVVSFYAGKVAGEHLKVLIPPADWGIDKTDSAIVVASTVAVWLPGMGLWSSLAGPVLLATPLGAIAAVPLLTVCAVSIGCYIGRRY